MALQSFGIRQVPIRGFRSARPVGFAPGANCALVGGPSVGTSNVLAAVWMLLQRGAPAPTVRDVTTGRSPEIQLSAVLGSGDAIALEAVPPASVMGTGPDVPVLLLPAALRSGSLVARPIASAEAARMAGDYFAVADRESSATPARRIGCGSRGTL